ncbi:UNVERIFIED_CONTAM: Pentatricopeptide repeat-containing protein [Sesamum angustifolium]|uniref:Pentatricopeptide repeat-containing protein n=1 Tax=Sesamum angustifolium TaxID=2727405 RepID=A0AAW2Q7S7_9LAMI
MRRRALFLLSRRSFSSEPEIPTLYSFLQPSIFSLKRTAQSQESITPNPHQKPTSNSFSEAQKSNLEATLEQSLFTNSTDEAWKSFKTLTSCSSLPIVFVLEKNPSLLEYQSVKTLLDSMRIANTAAPAFALVKSMFKNRFFMPFDMWGGVLVDICRKNGSFAAFLGVFHECCRIAFDEKVDYMKPDLAACNAALEHYCRGVESVVDAEKVVETMSVLGVRPDENSFGLLAYLYAVKGLDEKVIELEGLIGRLGVSDKQTFIHNLICGYVKSGNFQSVSATILHGLEEAEGRGCSLETCNEVVKGFVHNENCKSLANLIIESQKLEPTSIVVERSFGYGVITACISLGLLDKAHVILDEMNSQGACVGLGVYVPILKAYCKEQRTAEAAQLVTEICSLGLRLDVASYDALIESSMSCQDFQSAFSLFRDMREARNSRVERQLLDNHDRSNRASSA